MKKKNCFNFSVVARWTKLHMPFCSVFVSIDGARQPSFRWLNTNRKKKNAATTKQMAKREMNVQSNNFSRCRRNKFVILLSSSSSFVRNGREIKVQSKRMSCHRTMNFNCEKLKILINFLLRIWVLFHGCRWLPIDSILRVLRLCHRSLCGAQFWPANTNDNWQWKSERSQRLSLVLLYSCCVKNRFFLHFDRSETTSKNLKLFFAVPSLSLRCPSNVLSYE